MSINLDKFEVARKAWDFLSSKLPQILVEVDGNLPVQCDPANYSAAGLRSFITNGNIQEHKS